MTKLTKKKKKKKKKIRNNVIATKQTGKPYHSDHKTKLALVQWKLQTKAKTHYSKQTKCTRPHYKCIADILGEPLKQMTNSQDTRRQMYINRNWQKTKAHKRFKRTALDRQHTIASIRSKQSVSVFAISSTVRLLPSKGNTYRNLYRFVLCCLNEPLVFSYIFTMLIIFVTLLFFLFFFLQVLNINIVQNRIKKKKKKNQR